MPELTVQDMAAKLRSERFDRASSTVQALADPIADTAMMVTLEELRPYDLNPRITQNPKYDEIKASIRERGLDAPPAITRRPNEPHFIIRNGGNTRLSILRELWTETKDERFFRVPCLFRPWSARGEIVALTGHLAENELHGDLSFIERALGVEKARELYEQELGGKPLSQRELARRLNADGYPISHSLISRMQDTLQHLLPAIPTILYSGLGKPQVERMIALRKATLRVWELHALAAQPAIDFLELFQDVLSSFDADPTKFDVRHVQDELLKHMAKLLASDYDTLALEIIDAEGMADALNRDPAGQPSLNAPFPIEQRATSGISRAASATKPMSASPQPQAAPTRTGRPSKLEESRTATQPSRRQESPDALGDTARDDDLQKRHSLTEAPERTLDTGSVSAETGEERGSGIHDEDVCIAAARGGQLDSISDLWHIEPSLDAPSGLRKQIATLAAGIALEGSLAYRIETVNDGVGYVCMPSHPRSKEPPLSHFQRALLSLLAVLSTPYTELAGAMTLDECAHSLGPLLQGSPERGSIDVMPRLSDAGLVKLFRLICLTRRLVDLETAKCSPRNAESI